MEISGGGGDGVWDDEQDGGVKRMPSLVVHGDRLVAASSQRFGPLCSAQGFSDDVAKTAMKHVEEWCQGNAPKVNPVRIRRS